MVVIDIFRYRKNETPETNYLRWLCDDVGLDYESYRDLASTMLYFEFNDGFENDMNRTYDALANRENFEYEYDVLLDIVNDGKCGILEMMVMLARRAADIMYDADEGDETEYYFDIMFHNLGLEKFSTGRYDHQKVVKILQIFNERKYSRDGKGGLFRVSVPPCAMYEVEIWSQMNWYLTEKYFENG